MMFLIYLLIGMIVAGLEFGKLFKSVFTPEENKQIKELKSDEFPNELNVKIAIAFIITIALSVVIIFLYPLFLTVKIVRKVSKCLNKTGQKPMYRKSSNTNSN